MGNTHQVPRSSWSTSGTELMSSFVLPEGRKRASYFPLCRRYRELGKSWGVVGCLFFNDVVNISEKGNLLDGNP